MGKSMSESKKQSKNTVKGRNGGTLNPSKKGDPSPNPNGRPPKLLKSLNDELKKEGYEIVKPSQMSEAFELLLNLPQEKIRTIVMDLEIPFFLRIIGKKLLSEKGDEMLEKILDRTIGKPKLMIDHTSLGEKINSRYDSLTPEEIEKEFEKRGLPLPQLDKIR
jgi:hypothetical protein